MFGKKEGTTGPNSEDSVEVEEKRPPNFSADDMVQARLASLQKSLMQSGSSAAAKSTPAAPKPQSSAGGAPVSPQKPATPQQPQTPSSVTSPTPTTPAPKSPMSADLELAAPASTLSSQAPSPIQGSSSEPTKQPAEVSKKPVMEAPNSLAPEKAPQSPLQSEGNLWGAPEDIGKAASIGMKSTQTPTPQAVKADEATSYKPKEEPVKMELSLDKSAPSTASASDSSAGPKESTPAVKISDISDILGTDVGDKEKSKPAQPAPSVPLALDRPEPETPSVVNHLPSPSQQTLTGEATESQPVQPSNKAVELQSKEVQSSTETKISGIEDIKDDGFQGFASQNVNKNTEAALQAPLGAVSNKNSVNLSSGNVSASEVMVDDSIEEKDEPSPLDLSVAPVPAAPVASAADLPEEQIPSADRLQAELQEIANQHQLWLSSEGKEGKRATFRNGRFANADFSGLLLIEASFRNANLAGAIFTGADLQRADFAEATTDGAVFTNTNLYRANFQRAELNNTRFSEVSAAEIDFSNAKMNGVELQGGVLEQAVFRDADVVDSTFRAVNLMMGKCRGAHFTGCVFDAGVLNKSDFRDALFSACGFIGVQLIQAQFKNAQMNSVNMNQSDFTVALDVPASAQAESVKQEQQTLQVQAKEIETASSQLDERQRLLDESAAQQAALAQQFKEQRIQLAKRLMAYGKLCKITAITWALMSLAVMGISITAIMTAESASVNTLAIIVLALILLVPIVLSLLNMFRTGQVAKRLLSDPLGD